MDKEDYQKYSEFFVEISNAFLDFSSEENDSNCTYEIIQKDKLDYVTTFDLNIEKKIKNLVKQRFPDFLVVSEEDAYPKLEPICSKYWIIDPLDGTGNFIEGIPFCAISMAALVNNELVASLIIELPTQTTFKAFKGMGFFVNNKRVRLAETGKIHTPFVGVSSGFISCIQEPEDLKAISKYAKFRILGSQALHLAYVACGRMVGCVNKESKLWDDAAGILMLKEAGGEYHSYLFPNLPGNIFQNLYSKHDLFSFGYIPKYKKIYEILNRIILKSII